MELGRRLDALTGIRGIAVLFVVLHHLIDYKYISQAGVNLGAIGVAIFFSLSGFLMAYLYLDRPFSNSEVKQYVISRFSRIAPAYLAVVMVSFLICTYLDEHFVYTISSKNLIRHVLFFGNVSALWSIPPEIQFYGFFLVIWFSLQKFTKDRMLVYICIPALLIFFMLASRYMVPGTFLGSKVHLFTLGAIFGASKAAIDRKGLNTELFQYIQMIAFSISCLGIYFLPVVFHDQAKQIYGSLLLAVYVSFLIFIFSYATTFTKYIFGNRSFVFLGEVSFSMYLLNVPLLYFLERIWISWFPHSAKLPFYCLLLLFCSWLNFRLIERVGGRIVKKFFGSGNFFNNSCQSVRAVNDTRFSK